MNKTLVVFNRLLTDVSRLSGVQLHAPVELDTMWILKEGPALDKALLLEIETGAIAQGIPDWLMPLWSQFRSTRSALSLKYLRQVLVFGYKTEHEPTYEQLAAAQAAFVDTEEGITCFDLYFRDHCGSVFFRETRKIVSRLISRCDFSSVTPSHGPGAVYPSCRPSEKSNFRTIYPQIEEFYPYYSHFAALSSVVENGIAHSRTLNEGGNITAKLTAVPKDSRGPRLISVHPKEAIWIQQGLRRILERGIENHPWTKSKINFKDQSINGNLALESSLSGEFATIDLKDASDCISNALFEYLFGAHSKYFQCCRASHIVLFDGSIHCLKKYAPMGNATAFPVESVLFWAIVRAGISVRYGEICNDIYVFGDDIIIPKRFIDGAIEALVRSGLKPNPAKCFFRGSFRESCGVDAFNGVNVTPLRLKRIADSSLSNLVSMCAFAKSLRIFGYEETAAEIYLIVRRKLGGKLHLSNNPQTQGVYEWVDRSLSYLEANEPTFRWNRFLHRYETRVLLPIASQDAVVADDWYHLQDSLLRVTGEASERVGYPSPYRTRYSYGWTPATWGPVMGP